MCVSVLGIWGRQGWEFNIEKLEKNKKINVLKRKKYQDTQRKNYKLLNDAKENFHIAFRKKNNTKPYS